MLDRFLRYVRIDTQSNDDSPSSPSTPGQLDLSRLLADELRGFRLADVEMDAHGIVTATVPATIERTVPTIAWLAHVDTSPETSGRNVQPIVHRNYAGGDLTLPADPKQVIRVADCPDLENCVGHTLITTDGTTLLGADDKSGIAVIMEAVRHLLANPQIPHGPIRVCFSVDEEIGRGTEHLNPARVAADVAYTVDGEGVESIDCETFSADRADVTITGVNIHPAIAKGRMVNALRAMGAFLDRLPRDAAPETTDGKSGFIHPISADGTVAGARIKLILRSFETAELDRQADRLRRIATDVEQATAGVSVSVEISKQYRNVKDGLLKCPEAVSYAEAAMTALGLKPKRSSIRGGTDGSRLTEMGLPTPNLPSASHNFHSPLEWTSVEQMTRCRDILIALAQRWADHPAR